MPVSNASHVSIMSNVSNVSNGLVWIGRRMDQESWITLDHIGLLWHILLYLAVELVATLLNFWLLPGKEHLLHEMQKKHFDFRVLLDSGSKESPCAAWTTKS